MSAKQVMVAAPTQGLAIGIYPSAVDVDSALEALRVWGYRSQDISILMPEPHKSRIVSIDGALRWLGTKRIFVIPGLGPVKTAGPLRAAFQGMGFESATGLAGALASLRIPAVQARQYESRVKNGSSILCVHVSEEKWAKQAQDILVLTGAENSTVLLPATD